jgi:hypothetical protein
MAKTVPNEVLLISLATPTCEGTMMANIDTSNAIWNASIFCCGLLCGPHVFQKEAQGFKAGA